MKGKLEKIGNEWYVKYVHYDGGGSFRLPLHPNFVIMTDYVWVKGIKIYNGGEVEFTEVLVNPMGREMDPNDVGQNQSKCIWYAKPYLDEKEEQKQHLIDIMESDEELGLYDEPGVKEVKEIKLGDVFNDEKREGVKRVIHQYIVLKELTLVSPVHLQMTSNGHGEFPDSYKLTEKGIQYIIEQLNKE
jgi:hypothetical protein